MAGRCRRQLTLRSDHSVTARCTEPAWPGCIHGLCRDHHVFICETRLHLRWPERRVFMESVIVDGDSLAPCTAVVEK